MVVEKLLATSLAQRLATLLVIVLPTVLATLLASISWLKFSPKASVHQRSKKSNGSELP